MNDVTKETTTQAGGNEEEKKNRGAVFKRGKSWASVDRWRGHGYSRKLT